MTYAATGTISTTVFAYNIILLLTLKPLSLTFILHKCLVELGFNNLGLLISTIINMLEVFSHLSNMAINLRHPPSFFHIVYISQPQFSKTINLLLHDKVVKIISFPFISHGLRLLTLLTQTTIPHQMTPLTYRPYRRQFADGPLRTYSLNILVLHFFVNKMHAFIK